MKTYSAKPSDVKRTWYVIDASNDNLGRVSTTVANLLLGKHKPDFTKHIDTGDYVIVINADNLKVTGNKETKKIYYRHTGFPGGIKSTQMKDMDNIDIIFKSVRGMLPVNKLRDARLARLKIYSGQDHNHAAQQPKEFPLGGNK